MSDQGTEVRILMAEDDPDDRLIFKDAMEEARLTNILEFAVDGQDLLDRLRWQGKYAESGDAEPSLPDLILLDLNMPRLDGRAALEEIKKDPKLCHIPVVVLTTSEAEEDVLHSYYSGANSFITKPVTFDSLTSAVISITEYWFKIVRLPTKGSQ